MKPILMIDPGHGGTDPGGGTNRYWKEKDLALIISLYQYERFQELGLPVLLTRDCDMTLQSNQRTQLVRDSGARYCISNHINAGGGEGAEVIYSIYGDGKLANRILDAMGKAGQVKRRVFTRTLPSNPLKDYYFMHRETGSVETVIVEYGFADNEKDVKRLLNNWKDYAEAVIMAFCTHIGHGYVKTKEVNHDAWKYEGIEYLEANGILNDPEGWKKKIDEPMPVWAVTLLMKKLHENLKGE
ncbi:N-acetylmuramoyl-L-alanine amidase [Anaerosolibacter carboniphilus]|uniref:N-acetylmuramoyl-L-alanine amidase n=1 Tax=Anaerosolibacter carboniphilus TaxID=1417629 RepID=A0A841KVQ1_9FIRM|nr:N-acetylmuramoyl-L-alanine amidase [Anaerosolibacter carboniphilus]MBB6217511.1 N-acetylmuramoyl-L-alanine amidase [Anaerosolibacter carboniphilus]